MQNFLPVKQGQIIASGLLGSLAGASLYSNSSLLVISVFFILLLWNKLDKTAAKMMWLMYFATVSSFVPMSTLNYLSTPLHQAVIAWIGISLILAIPFFILSNYIKERPYTVHFLAFSCFSIPLLPWGYVGGGSPYWLSSLTLFPINPIVGIIILITLIGLSIWRDKLSIALVAFIISITVNMMTDNYQTTWLAKEIISDKPASLTQRMEFVNKYRNELRNHPYKGAVLPENFILPNMDFFNDFTHSSLWAAPHTLVGVNQGDKFGALFDEQTLFESRYPLPFIDWPLFSASIFSHHRFEIEGEYTGVAICFEITSPIATLPILIRDDEMVVMSNLWFDGKGYFSAKNIQNTHIKLYQRLMPVAVSRSVSH